MSFLVSPTEPSLLRAAGVVSNIPEKHGCDLMWTGNRKVCGAQRKEVKDFLESVYHGRLAEQLLKMDSVDVRFLILEGVFHWDRDGKLSGKWAWPWERKNHWPYLAGLQAMGVVVLETRSLVETVSCVEHLEHWTQKSTHGSILRRVQPKGKWGTMDSEEWKLWFLQGFEGVGPGLAKQMIEVLGFPVAWTVKGPEEFERVPGIGKKRAEGLWKSLAGDGASRSPFGGEGSPAP